MVSNIYKQDSSGKFAHFMLIICLFAEIEVNLQELLCLLRERVSKDTLSDCRQTHAAEV